MSDVSTTVLGCCCASGCLEAGRPTTVETLDPLARSWSRIRHALISPSPRIRSSPCASGQDQRRPRRPKVQMLNRVRPSSPSLLATCLACPPVRCLLCCPPSAPALLHAAVEIPPTGETDGHWGFVLYLEYKHTYNCTEVPFSPTPY